METTGDVEKGFTFTAVSSCLAMSLAIPMFVGGLCCSFGGVIACGHRILQDAYVNDPRFSAPILSSFEAGMVGCSVIVIPCSFIILAMMSCCARSGSVGAHFTVGFVLMHVYHPTPLIVAAGAVGTAILRPSGVVVLAPGWAAVCGLLGSVVIATAVQVLGRIMLCCGICAGSQL